LTRPRSSLGRGTSIGCSTTTRPPSGGGTGDPPRTRPTAIGAERRLRPAPASEYVEDVIEALALRADPNGCVGDTDPDQRVANLDALVETLSEWEGDNSYSPSELVDLAEPFREDPGVGPTAERGRRRLRRRRVPHDSPSQGDQDDVVVVADPGSVRHLVARSHARWFVAQGPLAGLAPPTNTEVPDDIAIPPFDGGLYGVGDDWDRDDGGSWARRPLAGHRVHIRVRFCV